MNKLFAICQLGLMASAWGQGSSATAIAQAFASGGGTAEAFSEAAALGSEGGTAIAEALSTAVAENGGDATAVASALAEAIAQSEGCGCPAADAYAQAIAEAFTTLGPGRKAATQAVAQAFANAGGSCDAVASALASAQAIAEGNGEAGAFAVAAAVAGVYSCLPSPPATSATSYASVVVTASSSEGQVYVEVLSQASDNAQATGFGRATALNNDTEVVAEADASASDGRIATARATAPAATDTGDAECSSIAATAAATPELSSLVEALTLAGLVETLSDPSFVATVLAPTNEAFDKLIASFGVTREQLLMDPQLTNILLYHVIGDAAVLSGDLQRQFCSVFWQDRAELTTLLGQTVTVDLSDGVSFVGFGSTGSVVVADVVACQAVVHVIDEVLLPDFDIIAAAVEAAEGS